MNQEIKILRSDLITKCDQYLNGEIGKSDLENYASDLIVDEYDIYDWDDEIISDVIFQWESQEINFPINKINIQLWKHQLETGENLLADYNLWNVHINRQKEISEKYKSKWSPINKKLIIQSSSDLNTDPICGFRKPAEKGTTGWFIWTGELPKSDELFKPIRAEELLQMRPQLIKFLGLEIGYQFLIDKKGYADVWCDETNNELK